MNWIRLAQAALLERFVVATLLCAQLGVLGALTMAILPFISAALEHSRPKRRSCAGGSTC